MTTRTQHTPGPWKVKSNGLHSSTPTDKGFQIVKDGPSNQAICSISSNVRTPNDFKESNARLIAAAPALLEALLECYTAMENGVHPESAGIKARAALQLAKGA